MGYVLMDDMLAWHGLRGLEERRGRLRAAISPVLPLEHLFLQLHLRLEHLSMGLRNHIMVTVESARHQNADVTSARRRRRPSAAPADIKHFGAT